MCGIIGISSNKPVSASIINSLKKLEYRGYDSAGIATLYEGQIKEVKSEGRVNTLEQNFDLKNLKGNIGIGHVRWATLVYQIVLMLTHIRPIMCLLFIMELLKIQQY